MPLSGSEQFFYFLFVVLLYGAPLILVALVVAWRRRWMKLALPAITTAVLVGALGMQLGFRVDLQLAAQSYDREGRAIDGFLGDLDGTRVIPGGFVGTEHVGSLTYTTYQFPLPDDLGTGLMEVSVPPQSVNAVAYIRPAREAQPARETARLILWPDSIELNPAVVPGEFFERYVPGEAPAAYGVHTLIVGMRPRRSIVVHPLSTSASRWRWRDALLELPGG